MYQIWTKGREFKSIIGSSPGSPSYNHYMRLFVLSGIDILITIPFNVWYFATWFPVAIPWPGWKSIHSGWSHIPLVTLADLTSNPSAFYQFEMSRWIWVAYGFIFFGLLGVSPGARMHYASAWQYLLCWRGGFSRKSSR
jgi:pheromone a factor receptor